MAIRMPASAHVLKAARAIVSAILLMLSLAAAPAGAAASIGFNWTGGGSTALAAGEDPFAGLYVGAVGGGNYTNVPLVAGTYTKDGLTLTPPASSLPVVGVPGDYPGRDFHVFYGTMGPVSTVFQRAAAGVTGLDESHEVRRSATYAFEKVPFAKYDLYVEVATGFQGVSTVAVGATTNAFAGYPSSGSWPPYTTDPQQITPSNTHGNWMVFTGLTDPNPNLVLTSGAPGWKAYIGVVQFVNATESGAVLLVR
jgi:hypothetical protein